MTGDGYYCTLQDVADRLKNITINNDTDALITTGAWAYNGYPSAVLKTSQVAKYIAGVEARVEDRVAQKYKVPVVLSASPKAYARMRDIVRGYVVGECYPILKLAGRAMDNPDDAGNTMSAYGVAKSRLEELLNDTEPFTDATRNVTIEESTDASISGEGETTYNKFDPRRTLPPW
jgi:hypothetical protein